jgi:hypothetical protein
VNIFPFFLSNGVHAYSFQFGKKHPGNPLEPVPLMQTRLFYNKPFPEEKGVNLMNKR